MSYAERPTFWTKCTLRRVRLNAGGYDASGAYWGVDAPLFYWQFEEVTGKDDAGKIKLAIREGHMRAGGREHAKVKLQAQFYGVRFFN